MSKKLGLENKYKQFIKPTQLGQYKAVMGKIKTESGKLKDLKSSTVLKRAMTLRAGPTIKQAASSVLKRSPIGKVVSAVGKAFMSKPGMFGAGVGIGANAKPEVFKNNKKMGGGMMRYKTGNAVKLSPKQKVIAAKAPPMNRIDGKDFAVLKAEKAKGRGQGLQDEKMKPGKIMKANKGVFAGDHPLTKKFGIKSITRGKISPERIKAYEHAKKMKGEDRVTFKDVEAALKMMNKKSLPEIKATGARMGKMIKADKGVFAEKQKANRRPRTLLDRDLPLKTERLRGMTPEKLNKMLEEYNKKNSNKPDFKPKFLKK